MNKSEPLQRANSHIQLSRSAINQYNFEIKFSVTQESVTLLNVLVFEAVSYVIYKEESLPGQKNLDSCLKKSTLRTVLMKVCFGKFEKEKRFKKQIYKNM